MSCLRLPAVNTPLEDDDLLAEILLRLSPQPSSLARAALVCKRWRSLASDPGFFGRFRRRHRRSTPLLGFFFRYSGFSFVPTLEAPNCVPSGRFSLQPGDGDRFLYLGCRHGLVLIFNIPRNQIVVWDPVTGAQHRLLMPPEIAIHAEKAPVNGAVLRPAGDVQHFQVILVVADSEDKDHIRAVACVYLSQTGVWGDSISTPLPSKDHMSRPPTLVFTGKPAVLAGDSLYWMLTGQFAGILEFDLEKQSLAAIHAPEHMLVEGRSEFWIMRAEGGVLGLLFQLENKFQLWKRTFDFDGIASWGLERTIELDKLLLNSGSPIILGLAEDNNVVFLWARGSIFMLHLESLKLKKLSETNYYCHCHPFESVYTTVNKMRSHFGYKEIKFIFYKWLTEYALHPFVLS